jgi:hypothetical protein
MTTPFGDKVEIIAELYQEYHEEKEWEHYFYINDLGAPLCMAISLGGATVTDIGAEWIEQSWNHMCEILKIDPYGKYESLDGMIDFALAE